LGDSSKRKVIIRKHKIPNEIMLMGNCLYTTEVIPSELDHWTVAPSEMKLSTPVDVTLSLVKEFKEGTQVPGHVFSALLQRGLILVGYKHIQRNFFDFERKVMVGEKYVVIPGVDISVTPSSTGFSLVCDVTNKVARTGTVLGMWQSSTNKTYFCRDLAGMVVYTSYNNRSYTIQKVDMSKKPSDTFELDDGRRISFAKYVQERYGVKVSTNDQPMLECVRAGNSLYLIPEFCQPTGIDERDRRDFTLMNAITEKLFPEPNKRQEMIGNTVKTVSESCSKLVKLNVSPAVKVSASVIPIRTLPPMRADYNFDPKNRVFRQGGKNLKRLLIVHHPAFDIRRLSDAVQDCMKKIGLADISISELPFNPRSRLGAKDLGKSQPDFVLFVTPNKNDKNIYCNMKTICTHDLHIPSQVVAEASMKNPKRAFPVMINVVRQMAVKLGKCPWVMPFNPCTNGTMIFGLDVCHSTPIHKSVVGVVASLDDTFGRYISDYIVQNRGKEVVQDLTPFVRRALEKYKKKNAGAYPKRILFLRDGVGDGQLEDVNCREVTAVRDTINEVCPTTPLTFVVVKKRIRTRLFSRGRNPEVGTIVDGVITHPSWYDFFLVSHETRHGTVSPTHYNVLLDEIRWPKSELQSFIYLLCYQYYNWDGSISVPAPCQYAHKMAFLYGRTLLSKPDEAPAVPVELEDTLLQI